MASQLTILLSNHCELHALPVDAVLEDMVLFRTRNGSIPRFIYRTPKWF